MLKSSLHISFCSEVRRDQLYKPYNIDAPWIEVNHTVKSAPHVVLTTSDTRHRTGDGSISATDAKREEQNQNNKWTK